MEQNNINEKEKNINNNSTEIEVALVKCSNYEDKTVINKYDREESRCRLVFQTAIGYRVIKNGEAKKYEERINTEFIYVYNYKNIESHESISLQCPNCGAPIQHLGVKKCPYCNAGIIDLALKTWKFNDISLN